MITPLALSLLLYSAVGDAVQLSLSRLDPISEPEGLLLRQLRRYRETAAAHSGNPLYSNDWAVQVYGGEEAADELAALHGFINMGKVHLWLDMELTYSGFLFVGTSIIATSKIMIFTVTESGTACIQLRIIL